MHAGAAVAATAVVLLCWPDRWVRLAGAVSATDPSIGPNRRVEPSDSPRAVKENAWR
jgi:hypothetical protein